MIAYETKWAHMKLNEHTNETKWAHMKLNEHIWN